MSDSTDRYEAEAERHRSNVDDVVDALRSKLSAGQMVDEAMNYVKRGQIDQVASNLGRQVRDNPLALGIIGAGIAWLAFGDGARHKGDYPVRSDGWRDYHDEEDRILDSRSPSRTYVSSASGTRSGDVGIADETKGIRSGGSASSSGSGSSLGSKASSAFSSAGDSVASAGSSVKGGASSAAHATAEGAREAGRTVSDAARSVGRSARDFGHSVGDTYAAGRERAYDGLHRAGDRADRTYRRTHDSIVGAFRDEPLVFGALAVAIGAAIGAALPPTRTEDRYLGDTRDRMRDEGYERAREAGRQARDIAAETYRAASEEAEAKGLKPSTDPNETIAGKVSDVARTAAKTAKDETEKRI